MGDVHHLPLHGREFFIGVDGSMLRATWHLDHDLVNVSVWRGDCCTETFQLARADAARLIAYLADGLAAGGDAVRYAQSPTPARVTDRLRRIVARAVAR